MRKNIIILNDNESGAAAVEFSLILVPFLLIINSILFYTLYTINRAEVDHLSYIAERAMSIYRENEFCNVSNTSYEYAILENVSPECIANELIEHLKANSVLLDQDQLDVLVDTTCLATDPNPECVTTVVSYSFDSNIPFLGGAIDIITNGDGL